MQRKLSNKRDRVVVKEIVNVIRANKNKKVKWRCELKNKLINFTYYLKLFFILSYTIKLFYQTYLIYLIT